MRIYKTLDNPNRILFWRIEEFLLFCGMFAICLLSESLILAPVPIVFWVVMAKLRKRFVKGSFFHALYWKFYWDLGFFPPSCMREFVL